MPKYQVKLRPSGLINGQEWPEEGETVDLPETVGEDMAQAGWLSAAKAEKRPARKGQEQR